AAFVLGAGAHAAEAALDHVRRETLSRSEARRHRLRQADDFERARPIRQPADEAALLERGDQPVDTGLGAQIERLLHLLERGRHARFLQALVNEAEKLVLFAGEHFWTRWAGIGVETN